MSSILSFIKKLFTLDGEGGERADQERFLSKASNVFEVESLQREWNRRRGAQWF